MVIIKENQCYEANELLQYFIRCGTNMIGAEAYVQEESFGS